MASTISSGAWSNPLIWNTGVVPVNLEANTITAGHDVEFDVDQSGFPNGQGVLTINGNLYCKTTGGPYYMKMAGNITGTGTLRAGTSKTVPLPYATKFTIYFNGAYYFAAPNLLVNIYCALPTNKWVRLSAPEAIGQTELSVDTNVIGDLWADGDTVYICNINNAIQRENRVIAAGGIAAGTITVTAGLTNAKLQGAYIVLSNRNVRIEQTGGGVAFLGVKTLSEIYAEMLPSATASSLATQTEIRLGGCAYSTCNYGYGGGARYGFVDDIAMVGFGVSGLNAPYDSKAVNSGFFASGRGAYNPMQFLAVNCVFAGNTSGFDLAFGTRLAGCSLIGNTYALNQVTGMSRNTVYSSGTNFYNNVYKPESFFESFDHNGTPGAYYCQNRGGYSYSQAGTVPVGFTQAVQSVCQSATYPVFWQEYITVPAGQTGKVVVWLRKDAAMAILPKAEVFKSGNEPMLDASCIITSFTMTNSINTWESSTLTINNTSPADEQFTIRISGQNATNNVYSVVNLLAGGGISRAALVNAGGV